MGEKWQNISHEIDYKIFGKDIQYIEIELDPDETVIAEPGAMMFMEEDVSFRTKMGDGSEPGRRVFRKLKAAIMRSTVSESVFIAHFTNTASTGKRRVGFTIPFPGMIAPINLSETESGILVQRTSFLCAALGTRLDIDLNRGLMSGQFGGEGFAMLRIEGDGLAFIHAGGNVAKKHLDDETLRIETSAVVAFEPHLKYSVALAGGLKSMLFGDEGMFLTTLSGTGHVWIQSLAFDHYTKQVVSRVKAELDDSHS